MPLDLFDWADARPQPDAPPVPLPPALSPRAQRGVTSYHRGQSAEDIVARDYAQRGYLLAERRWRGRGGEIDLIFRGRTALVFVEVKAARDFDAAMARITPRQVRRICTAAEEYLAGEPTRSLTEVRFDAALVDATGRVSIVEAAFGEDGWSR